MTTTSQYSNISTVPVVSKLVRAVGVPKNRFNQFGLEYGRLLADDYVQKKLLTVKYTGKGRTFSVSGKGSLDLKAGTDKVERPVTSSEIKITTNFDGRNLEARFDNKGGIRLWGNVGTYHIGRPVIVTTKVKTNNTFSNWSGNVAAEYEVNSANLFARLDIKNGNIPYFSEKNIFNVDKFQLGQAFKLNLQSYTLARYNFFLAYRERDFSIVAEHTSRNKAKFELGKLILAATYKRAGDEYVLKGSYRPYKVEQYRFKVGAVSSVNKNTTVRAKINNNTKLSLSARYRYNSNLSLVAGTQVNVLNPSSMVTKKTVPIPLGIVAEFSYA